MNKLLNKDILKIFCQKNHIKKLSVFGSYITEKFDENSSDIDLLAEFDKEYIPDLFSISLMELELCEKLGHKIDLKTPGDLSRFFRNEVLKNAKVIYE
ncbi:MAG: uncharacterized protein QG635_2028 [Bacteroidota bacterium]|nr:uncharacterized protein [Bacteroidota bacterium]